MVQCDLREGSSWKLQSPREEATLTNMYLCHLHVHCGVKAPSCQERDSVMAGAFWFCQAMYYNNIIIIILKHCSLVLSTYQFALSKEEYIIQCISIRHYPSEGLSLYMTLTWLNNQSHAYECPYDMSCWIRHWPCNMLGTHCCTTWGALSHFCNK